MKKKDQARYIALNVLIKVNKEGKYSNISLKEALKNRDLSNRDKAFVTQLVYGCLEKQIAIDHIISKFASLKRTNPWIVNIPVSYTHLFSCAPLWQMQPSPYLLRDSGMHSAVIVRPPLLHVPG